MANIKVKCSKCGHEFYMDEYKNVSCPKCGAVIKGPKAKQQEFWIVKISMEDVHRNILKKQSMATNKSCCIYAA